MIGMSTNKGYFIQNKTIEITKLHGDLSQEVVIITVDKLKLILHTHINSIKERKSWIAPAGILLTIITVLVTGEFKDIIFPRSTWTAIFVITGGLMFIWLVKALWKAWHSETVQDLVEKIKQQDN